MLFRCLFALFVSMFIASCVMPGEGNGTLDLLGGTWVSTEATLTLNGTSFSLEVTFNGFNEFSGQVSVTNTTITFSIAEWLLDGVAQSSELIQLMIATGNMPFLPLVRSSSYVLSGDSLEITYTAFGGGKRVYTFTR